MGSCARKIPKQIMQHDSQGSSCHVSSRAILHDACDKNRTVSKGELKKRKQRVKQNEITWFDKIPVAGLGPRAVLAAVVVGSQCYLLSHMHMLTCMILLLLVVVLLVILDVAGKSGKQ